MSSRVSLVIGSALLLVLVSGSVVGASPESDPTPVGADIGISPATADAYAPAVAWNQAADQYLVVWEDRRAYATRGYEIYGRRVGTDGVAMGAAFRISTAAADEFSPAVAWNATANQYLVVWMDHRSNATRGTEIYGRRVGADGVPVGADFRISTSIFSESGPEVAWNATANQYLVVWVDERRSSRDVFGRRVGADGVVVGADFRISTSTADEDRPSVVWNATANQYLVVWQDWRNSPTRDIRGRRVGADGVPIGAAFRISTGTADAYYPAVAWNQTANQYFVVWTDSRSLATRGDEIYGRRVSVAGVGVGGAVRVSTSVSQEYTPTVTWNATANQYLVVWMDRRTYATRGYEIYGRRVASDGAGVGADFLISTATTDEYLPGIVWNATANQYLVVWEDGRNSAAPTLKWGIYGRKITGDSAP